MTDASGLSTRRVRLRPVEPRDIDFLYAAVVDPRNAFRWRYGGGTPSPASFERDLYEGVLVQFLVEGVANDEPLGLVVCYRADTLDGYS